MSISSSYSSEPTSNIHDFSEENPYDYKFGGYHNVQAGDVYNGIYRIESKMGWGYFSTVWLASNLRKKDGERNKYVAVKFHKSLKKYSVSAMIELENLERIRALDPLGEKRVVSLLDCFLHEGLMGTHVCLVFEVLGDNMFNEMEKRESEIKETEDKNPHCEFRYSIFPVRDLKKIAKDMLEGLAFLHDECKLIHTDIKPENVSFVLPQTANTNSPKKPQNGQKSENNCSYKELIANQILKAKETKCERKPLSAAFKEELLEVLTKIQSRLHKHEKKSQQLSAARKEGEAPEPALGTDLGFCEHCKQYVAEKSRLSAKIVDLGTSVESHKKYFDEITTRQYRSPEVILGQRYTTAVDIWATACVLFEIATGDCLFSPEETEFKDKNADHLQRMIQTLGPMPRAFALRGSQHKNFFDKKGNLKRASKWGRKLRLPQLLAEKYRFPAAVSAEFAAFLAAMLAFDPAERTTARRALAHPWLRDA